MSDGMVDGIDAVEHLRAGASRSAFFASYSSALIAPRSRRSARLASVRVTSSADIWPGPARRRRRAPRRRRRGRGGGGRRAGEGAGRSACAGPGIGRRAGQLQLQLVLRLEHRPLEVVGVAEHPEPRDPALGRRQDLEVAEAEHPPEDRLGQDRVVDLLERAVDDLLVDDALDLEDPPEVTTNSSFCQRSDLPAEIQQAADDEDRR